jgi:trigger factor
MKVKMEKIEKNTVVLEVEVDVDQVHSALDKAYHKVVKKVNVPGFRQGKVPKSVLEQKFGKEIFFDDALDFLLPEAYAQAVEESKIEPVDRPQVDVIQLVVGQPLIFKATVQVKPEVQLGEYKGLSVEKPNVEVSDEDVQKELASMQQKHAKLNTLEEGTVEKADVAVIDFEGFVNEVAFEGGKGEAYPLEIGSGSFIPGFEEQIVGAAIGEERDVKVTFPEEYHAVDLAGKEAVFKVKVNSIKRKEVSTLDDEFAKDVSEFDTLEELKADILNKLKEAAEKNTELAVKNQVIEKAVANAEVEIPEAMVNSRIDMIVNDMANRLQRQGLSLDDYLKFTNSNMETIRSEYRNEAEQSVKADLILEAIAKAEEIKVTDSDLDEQIQEMAKHYNQEPEQLKNILAAQGSLEYLTTSITMDKTVSFLVDNAKIA